MKQVTLYEAHRKNSRLEFQKPYLYCFNVHFHISISFYLVYVEGNSKHSCSSTIDYRLIVNTNTCTLSLVKIY